MIPSQTAESRRTEITAVTIPNNIFLLPRISYTLSMIRRGTVFGAFDFRWGGAFFHKPQEQVRDAGVPSLKTHIGFQDMEQEIVKPAERPYPHTQDHGDEQRSGKQQDIHNGQSSCGKKQDTLEHDQFFARDITHSL